ncbi:hypothetical protein DPMN_159834 [Dreissena polymorpha]|uniref:Uncharacterized protein n=1 Tax=Dreissena polymorpha TaxID=45954 RepID=A0A9D4IPI9_DREPO|nr:hypothetical protein DPMN_159834 [Dreissena polymorpha]
MFKVNVILTQLLTKKLCMNTHSTMNTSGVVQTQILPNNINTVLKVYPSWFVTSTSHSKTKQPRIELTQDKALKNDSSFVVWSSMPFDSNPTLGRTQTQPLAITQILEPQSLDGLSCERIQEFKANIISQQYKHR